MDVVYLKLNVPCLCCSYWKHSQGISFASNLCDALVQKSLLMFGVMSVVFSNMNKAHALLLSSSLIVALLCLRQ